MFLIDIRQEYDNDDILFINEYSDNVACFSDQMRILICC